MKKIQPAKIVTTLPASGIRAFFELVLSMDDVISLGVGEPDYNTPWAFCESAIYSLERGFTSYTSNKGMLEFRSAITDFLRRRYKLSYDAEDQVLITVGVSQAIDLAMRAVLNRDDEVLIPEPCYVSYSPMTILAGGVPVVVPASASNGFRVTAQDLRKHVTSKTKAILINYPSNPTGASYSRRDLQAIGRLAEKHNLLIISDEIYDELTYEKTHVPFPTLPGMKARTIYLNGFSKAYAMTGWRIGYACGPKNLIAAMTKIHQYSMLCAPIMSQFAGIEALRDGLGVVETMRNEYRRRRNFVVEELNRIGLPCTKPEGAFYVFPSIRKSKLSAVDFATQLLEKEKVAVVPGVAFGKSGEGYVRMAYATSFDELREALKRIEHFLGTLKKRRK